MAVDSGKLGLVLRNQGALAPLPARRVPTGGLRLSTGSRGSYIPPDQRKKPKDDAPDGVLDWFGDAVSDIGRAAVNIVPGAYHLGVNVGKQILTPVRLGVDVARGDISLDDAGKVLAAQAMPWQKEEWGISDLADKYSPISQQMGTSFGQTALRLRHPSRYLDAIKRGDIVDVALEDAGNISLVAAPLGKVLGAGARTAEAAGMGTRATAGAAGSGAAGALAQLERGARITQKMGGQFSDLPVSLPRQGLRIAGKRIGGLLEGSEALRARFPQWATPEARAWWKETRAGDVLSNRRRTHLTKRFEEQVGSRNPLDSLPEEGAAMALINGVGAYDDFAIQQAQAAGLNVTPEQVRQMHQTHDLPEQSYSPEAQAIVREYRAGTLAPEIRARVDKYMEVARRELDTVTDRALNGDGRRKGTLDPRYLGDDPFDEFIAAALEKQGVDKATLDMLDQQRQQGVTWDDLDAQNPALGIGAILDSPDVYPTAWRPSMQAALRVQDELGPGVSLPIRPADQLAAGLDRPQYLPGGNSDMVNPRSNRQGLEPTNVGSSGIVDVTSENFRGIGKYQPYSFRALADHLGREVSQTTRNQALLRWVETSATKRVNAVISEDWLTEARAEAERMATIERATNVKARAQEHFGQMVDDKLREHNLEVLHGDLENPRNGDFSPDVGAEFSRITEDTVVVPAGTKESMRKRWDSKDMNKVLRGLRAVNAAWKRNVLPFSVRWHLGDMVGGAFMSWTAGGIPPWEMLSSLKRLDDIGPDAQALFDRYVLDNENFIDQGLNMQQMEWLRGEGVARREPRTRLGKRYDNVRNRSFKANDAINRFNRHHYVAARLQKLLDERGLSLDNLADDAGWNTPEVQRAVEDAVTDANKTMGVFDDLTPFEQRWMKNIFPFYVWQRHITKLAWRMAVDNPARLMWTLRLGAYGAGEEPELPAWLRGSIEVNGILIPTNYINPLNDVASGGMFSDPFKSMSPAIKMGVALTTGADLSKGLLQVTRPYGTGNFNPDTGAPENTPLITRPLEALYYGARMLPIPRVAMDVAPTGEIGPIGFGPHPRYGQGTLMVNSRGEPIDTNSRLAKLGGLIGLPMPTTLEDAEAIMASGQRRKKRTGQASNQIRIGL